MDFFEKYKVILACGLFGVAIAGAILNSILLSWIVFCGFVVVVSTIDYIGNLKKSGW